MEDVQRSKEFHMVNVNLPPTKQARVDYTHHVAHEDYGFNLKEKLESIVEDNTESKKYLEVYGTYFHNQLTTGLVSLQSVLQPTKEVHYVCRIFAYIYRLTFIEPQKVSYKIKILPHKYSNFFVLRFLVFKIYCLHMEIIFKRMMILIHWLVLLL